MTRIWTELRGPEFGGLSPETIAILPVGSAEQHGPHLPLNTDFVVADSLARDVVAGYGDELGLLLLPSMAVSKSNEHAWSPGTLWLSAATLLTVLD
jgi:creatinine amidohydrolase